MRGVVVTPVVLAMAVVVLKIVQELRCCLIILVLEQHLVMVGIQGDRGTHTTKFEKTWNQQQQHAWRWVAVVDVSFWSMRHILSCGDMV